MSPLGSNENAGLTKVKNPNDIGVVLAFDNDFTPTSFKNFLVRAIKPTVDSTDLLQRKTITETELAKLSDMTLAPIGGIEESKENVAGSEEEAKKDDDKTEPSSPKKENEVIRFFVKVDFMNTLVKATTEALKELTKSDEDGLKSSVKLLMKEVAFTLLQGRHQYKLRSNESSQNAIARAFSIAQSQVDKGKGFVTFILNPNWYPARTESKWDTTDIRCITANKDIEIEPETEQSNFSPTDVGGGINASTNKQAFSEFSNEVVKTI